MDRKLLSVVIAQAVATLVLAHAAPAFAAGAAEDHPCQNNSCAGKASCKGYGNASCKGQNTCKGMGWLDYATKDACELDGRGIWHAPS